MTRIALVAVLCAGAVVAAAYLFDTYTVNVLTRSFLFAAVAMTVDVLWGYSGFLTFGQSAFFGVGAYAAALCFSQFGCTPEIVALSLACAIGAACVLAALQGFLSFYQGSTPLYASVVSLVVPVVVTQALFSGGTFTGSSSGLTGYDVPDLSIEAWFMLAGLFLVVVTTAGFVFVRSDAGRVLVALRDNEARCAYLGLRTAGLRIGLLVATAVIAALAGWIYAGSSGVVAPELAGFVFGTELVIWVALGGRGTLLGPVFGTLLIDLTSSYLSGSLPFLWKLLLGVAFIVVIVALPQGLIPALVGRLRALRPRAAVLPRLVAAPQRPRPSADHVAIALNDVARSFGKLAVLQGISFSARPGELVSLVGPNGAGKTTLMRCLSDGAERSGGTVAINGHDIATLPPHRCVAFGLGRKFQTANVFDTLTVGECLAVARARLAFPSPWRCAATLALPDAALAILRATGLDTALGTQAALLSHGQKQALELAMVLALEPSVVLLDEPTAGLTTQERRQIGGVLTELADTHGLCLLLVEHDLDFVRQISSRVVVLHQGKLVLDGTVAEIVGSELVRTIYAGAAHA
jgi:branched-chain amino acid transport system permease protein